MYEQKGIFTHATVLEALRQTQLEDLKKTFGFPPHVQGSCGLPTVSAERESLYVAGRYNKYSRLLSQSPWLIDGVRKSESSVQEIITEELARLVGAEDVKFCSAGREDCDVRMLGKGRPFVCEFINPKRMSLTKQQLHAIQQSLRDSDKPVAVRDLQVVTKDALNRLKEGEETKKKTYKCPIWLEKDLSEAELARLFDVDDLTVEQQTPLRVLHRRTLCARSKQINRLRCRKLKPHFIELTLTTQAGTYIKEFVHGDMGRTVPSVASIAGCRADILSLDVVDVDLDFPPPVDAQ